MKITTSLYSAALTMLTVSFGSYAIQLAEFLDKKEALIYKLQSKLLDFQDELAKEQHLAQHVRLTQY